VPQLLFEIIPLALAGAISPVVLMGALAILDGPRAVAQSAAFSVGVIGTTIVLFLLGFLVALLRRDGHEIRWFATDTAHVLVGLMLIGAGVFLGSIKPNAKRSQEFSERFLSGLRPLRDFVIAGVVLMITNMSTFVVLIAILHEVARADVGAAEETFMLAVATFIVVLPATAPLAAAVVGGEGTRARLGQISRLSLRYGRYAMAAIWIAFGAKDLLAVALG
jgi:membrane-bound acyltransferase YfiQ involved in biofilm formation